MSRNHVSNASWPGLRTHHAWLAPHEGATTTGAMQIGVSFSDHRGLVQQHAGMTRETDVAAGATFVTGADPITWLRVREHTEALEMYPDLGFLAETAQVSVSRLAITPRLGPGDPVILAIASRFRVAHAADAPLGEVEASELALRVALRLIDRHMDIRLPVDRFHGQLSEARLRRVADYIEAHLGEALDVSRLAAQAALSPAHFSRAFRRTTGLTPQQYVTSRRLSRAKQRILARQQTVAGAAAEVGFSNLSHFRRLFRAAFGFAPGSLLG